jgi:hypothetical protein
MPATGASRKVVARFDYQAFSTKLLRVGIAASSNDDGPVVK